MLRTILIGAKTPFNEVLAHWLAGRSELVAVVWTNATAWQESWGGRFRFVARRLRRHGPVKTVDEALFYLYYRARLLRRDEGDLLRRVVEPYWAEHGSERWEGDAIWTDNVNSPAVLDFLS